MQKFNSGKLYVFGHFQEKFQTVFVRCNWSRNCILFMDILTSCDLFWLIISKALFQKQITWVGFFNDTLIAMFVQTHNNKVHIHIHSPHIYPLLENAVCTYVGYTSICLDLDAQESVQNFATKICTKPWNTLHCLNHLEALHLDTHHMKILYLKQCHLYTLAHGVPIFLTLQFLFPTLHVTLLLPIIVSPGIFP